MPDRQPRWAKAPDATGTADARRLRAATAADRAEFLEHGLVPVSCAQCATRVLVKKNSPQHTSVQWQSDPAASCPEFAAAVAAGQLSARIGGCGALRASIAAAARAGRLPVTEDGEQVDD